MLECVINVSEGRRSEVIDALVDAAGTDLLDLHSDPFHNRSVVTVIGERAPRAIAGVAVERIDLREHEGVHPRIGAIDVVPFVPLSGSTMAGAVDAAEAFAAWVGDELALPSFLYGERVSLPDVRRRAFDGLAPDFGPSEPHPTAGAVAVGARRPLVAFNVWLESFDVDLAKSIAAELRSGDLRALGLAVGARAQVSMNLVNPEILGPDRAYDLVASRAKIADAELVGLVPENVLRAIDPQRWAQLDLGIDRTIEARVAARRR